MPRVVINSLKENTFYAQIHLRVADKDVLVDSRPSDAIALALRLQRARLRRGGRPRDEPDTETTPRKHRTRSACGSGSRKRIRTLSASTGCDLRRGTNDSSLKRSAPPPYHSRSPSHDHHGCKSERRCGEDDDGDQRRRGACAKEVSGLSSSTSIPRATRRCPFWIARTWKSRCTRCSRIRARRSSTSSERRASRSSRSRPRASRSRRWSRSSSGRSTGIFGSRTSFRTGEDRASYDAILIDTPPTLGMITVNALVASTHILIPIQSSYFALEGTDDLLETIEKIKNRPNPNLQILGVVITLHDKRTTLGKDIQRQIDAGLQGQALQDDDLEVHSAGGIAGVSRDPSSHSLRARQARSSTTA